MDLSYVATTSAAQWGAWHRRNVAVREDGIELATEPRITATDLGVAALDVAVDPDGLVFALRHDGSLYRHDRDRGTGRVIAGPDTVADPRALCIAGDRVYVADADSGDLVAVSERDGTVTGRVEGDLTTPLELQTVGGTLYALDGGDGDGGTLSVLRGQTGLETALRGIESPQDMAVDDAGSVYVLQVEDGQPVISLYEARYVESPNAFPYRRTVEEFAVEGADETLLPSCIEMLGDGAMLVQGQLSESGTYAVCHYRFEEFESGTFERRYGFDTPCRALHVGPLGGGGRYPSYLAIGGEEGRVYAVEETKRYRRNESTELYSGQLFRRLDAGSDGTDWHRLTLEFDRLPSSSQVLVSYYATDEAAEEADGVEALEDVTADDAQDLREGGVETVWDLLERDPDSLAELAEFASPERAREWTDAALELVTEEWSDRWHQLRDANPDDALLEAATGRYLHLRLELVGDVETSPRVGELRAYCPKQTYVRHLPEIFRERSSPFLERYLSVFQSYFLDLEEEIETVTRYFDPEGVPREYLQWLANWLAVEYDEGWPEGAKREFLARAPELFRMRGTKQGLAAMVRLYLAHVEEPDTTWMTEWQRARIEQRRADGQMAAADAETALDRLSARGEPDRSDHLLYVLEHLDLDDVADDSVRRPYTRHMHDERSFTAFVGPFARPEHRRAVERIVANEKPAHAGGSVVEIRHHCKLGGDTFLGINSTLTPREFVLGRATLGSDTVLSDREPLS